MTATNIRLDPQTRMMRIDRKSLGLSKAPLEIPFHDISRLETRSFAGEYATNHVIRVELRSGERHFVNGGDEKKTAVAVEAMTSYLDLRPEDATSTELAKRNRRMDLVWALVALVIVAFPLVGDVRSYFVLPACDDEAISKTLAKILTKHGGGPDVDVSDLSDVQTLADADKSRSCQATWSRNGADVAVNYSIVWDGWTPQVKASWRR